MRHVLHFKCIKVTSTNKLTDINTLINVNTTIFVKLTIKVLMLKLIITLLQHILTKS